MIRCLRFRLLSLDATWIKRILSFDLLSGIEFIIRLLNANICRLKGCLSDTDWWHLTLMEYGTMILWRAVSYVVIELCVLGSLCWRSWLRRFALLSTIGFINQERLNQIWRRSLEHSTDLPLNLNSFTLSGCNRLFLWYWLSRNLFWLLLHSFIFRFLL